MLLPEANQHKTPEASARLSLVKLGTFGFLLIAVLLFSGCPTLVKRRSIPPASPSPYSTPPASQSPQGSSPATDFTTQPQTEGETGVIILTLVDQNGLHPEGIPIDFFGSSSGRLISDKQGVVRLEGQPGSYSFQVAAGCFPILKVTFGQSGGGTLVQGRETRGNLAVRWEHRVAPGVFTGSTKFPYWPPGDEIEVFYDVRDRCRSTIASHASFPTYVIKPGANVEILSTPKLESDENGRSSVKVRCLREGPAELVAEDSRNPGDVIDLIYSPSEQQPSCKVA